MNKKCEQCGREFNQPGFLVTSELGCHPADAPLPAWCGEIRDVVTVYTRTVTGYR